jgi:transcriptional regulator with XRE-family HTH domain
MHRLVIVDPAFPARLRELRGRAGLSLRALGRLVNYSHGYLWDLESGAKRPTVQITHALDSALNAGGDLTTLVSAAPADSPLPPAIAPAGEVAVPAGLEFAGRWQHGVELAADLWRADMRRRQLLTTGWVAGAFALPAMRWLTAPLDEQPRGDGDRVVGEPDVEMIRRLTATFRGLDNQYGGGRIRESVVRFLDAEVTPALRGRYDRRTGAALFSAAAEATRVAGWAAYDDGLHGLCQRYMIQSLRLAMAAGDRPLGAEILAAMSHQAAYLGQAGEAVDLARAAGRTAADAGVAAISAEAAVLEAHGHALGGDETACAIALDRAEHTLDRADRHGDPQWIGYFDEAYLAAKFGHCFAALGRGDLALRFATRSLRMDGAYVRGRQFNLALLARSHAQTGEVEQAAAVGTEAAELALRLRSARARDYIADLADRLAPYAGLPAVRDFTVRARPVLTLDQ